MSFAFAFQNFAFRKLERAPITAGPGLFQINQSLEKLLQLNQSKNSKLSKEFIFVYYSLLQYQIFQVKQETGQYCSFPSKSNYAAMVSEIVIFC